MCRRTEGTFTRCVAFLRFRRRIQNCRLTYLLFQRETLTNPIPNPNSNLYPYPYPYPYCYPNPNTNPNSVPKL